MSRKLMYLVALATCLGAIIAAAALASAPVAEAPPPQGRGLRLAEKYTEIVRTQSGEKLSFDMVLIPAGSFLMGSPAGEAGRSENEGPQHQVRLEPFYLCTTETTLELFLAYYQETVSAKKDFVETEQAKKAAEQASSSDVDAITGPTPVYGDLTMGYSGKHPGIGMTWHNAMTFCQWLSNKTGKQYRLPTEAEWEYACRAGGSSVFGFAPAPVFRQEDAGAPNELADFAWCKANSDGETQEVAKKKPNAWGLYDMLGNVREWVYDFYSPAGYTEAAKKNPALDPKGPETGQVHVARGGDYRSSMEELRPAARAFEEKWWRSGDPQIPKSKWWLPEMDFIGFRVARSAETRPD